MSEIPDIESMLSDLEQQQNRMQEIKEEAATRRYTGTSDDRAISVTVDGTGKVHAVEIPDKELRGSHPSQIGPKVVSAVNNARAQAVDDSNQKFLQEFPAFNS